MTHQEHSFKDRFNLLGVTADETGDGGEVRHGVAGLRFENDIALAAPFNLAAGGNALRVREQNDLEQNCRVIGGATVVVVAVFGVKDRQIEFLYNQVIQCVFKGAWLNLILEVHDHHGVLVVVVRNDLLGTLHSHVHFPNYISNYFGSC
jgi:hypothetical protein